MTSAVPDPAASGALPEVGELERRATAQLASWRVPDTQLRVFWNDRLTTTAGRAFLQRGQIELNPHLMSRAPETLDAVLVHEAAHLAAFRLFGPNIPAHGRHWRSLMRLAGHAPEVTHRIPVDDLRQSRTRSWFYLRWCGGCGSSVLAVRVRYGRCPSCDQRDRYRVWKAPRTPAGRQALLAMAARQGRGGVG